ncbi:MAG: hypothetical protein Q4F45_02645 [Alistipes sp.]|nr:hypothetical protein [Alistipes sp.]
MRRLIIIFFAILFCAEFAQGQNVIIGEKIPTIKSGTWLMDAQPEEATFSCIIFYHSESKLCQESLKKMITLCQEYPGQFNLTVITKEEHDTAGVTLTSLLSDYTGILFDESGTIFKNFGVKFLPFSVICNSKGRVLWCGNPATLNIDVFKNIVIKNN